jgi:NAD(P)-dependent dehydrogenase (short-subunit alcohol dehydrogenase family)
MGRCGTTEDIANMAIFLASEAASYMTGEIVRLDGGQVLTGGMMIDPESLVS